jgi:hypothetical protein
MQVHTVNSNNRTSQTANVAYFQRKIRLSGFSAYPDGSPSQLILISGVLLYTERAENSYSFSFSTGSEKVRLKFCDKIMCQDSVLCIATTQRVRTFLIRWQIFIYEVLTEINRYTCSSTHQWLDRGWEDSHNISSVSIHFGGGTETSVPAGSSKLRARSQPSLSHGSHSFIWDICPWLSRKCCRSLLSHLSVSLRIRDDSSPSQAPHGSCTSCCICLGGGACSL